MLHCEVSMQNDCSRLPNRIEELTSSGLNSVTIRAAGFKGFCPVELRDRRELIDTNPQFTATFGLPTYTFSLQRRPRPRSRPIRLDMLQPLVAVTLCCWSTVVKKNKACWTMHCGIAIVSIFSDHVRLWRCSTKILRDLQTSIDSEARQLAFIV